MKNLVSIGLGLAIIIMAVILYSNNVERAIVEHDLKQSVKFNKGEAKRFRNKYDSLYAFDSTREALYINAIHRADRAEQVAINAKKQLQNEINRNRTFSDAVTDSLLANIR